MNDTGTILIFIGIFLLGGLIGFIIYHVSLGKTRTGVKQQELDEAKAELEQYKEKVNDHFMNSAGLMQQVATSYQALHTHMATQSDSLLSEQGVSPYPLLEPDSPQADEESLLEETDAGETNKTTDEDDVVTSQENTAETEQKDSSNKESTATQEAPNDESVANDESVESEAVPPKVERPKDYVDNKADVNDTVSEGDASVGKGPESEKK